MIWKQIKRRLRRLSLAQQFLLINLIILIIGMATVGWWVGEQIKIGIIDYSAATTALYVDSFVAPHVQELAYEDAIAREQITKLDGLLRDTPLGQKIVAFKIWDAEGRIVYAANPTQIGQTYPIHGQLAQAWQGQVASEISDLQNDENVLEREQALKLLETYSPVRQAGTNRIIAVAEFYQPIDDLQAEIFTAQLRSWLLVGVAMLVMYLLLTGIVKPASDVIVRQEHELREKVARLTELLDQNKTLNERVRRAATRTTALNEHFLRRISAELHDGPGQDLGLALLRIESLAEGYHHRSPFLTESGASIHSEEQPIPDDFHTVQVALASALTDLRAISAGLRLPKIEPLSLPDTIQRAIRDYERKTENKVTLRLGSLPPDIPLPIKMTTYRILQESLANGYRHADGKNQQVQADVKQNDLYLEISDRGQGFKPDAVPADNGHFGLAGMRERVEILGGHFEVESQAGQGTKICVYLPLTIPEGIMSV